MKRMRNEWPWYLLAASALLAVVALGSGCGTTNMDTAIAVRGIASDAFNQVKTDWLAWDKKHQQGLIADAKANGGRASYDKLIANYRDQIQRRIDTSIKRSFLTVEALDAAIKTAKANNDQGLVGAIAQVWISLGILATDLRETGVAIPIPAVMQPKEVQITNPNGATAVSMVTTADMSAKSKEAAHGR